MKKRKRNTGRGLDRFFSACRQRSGRGQICLTPPAVCGSSASWRLGQGAVASAAARPRSAYPPRIRARLSSHSTSRKAESERILTIRAARELSKTNPLSTRSRFKIKTVRGGEKNPGTTTESRHAVPSTRNAHPRRGKEYQRRLCTGTERRERCGRNAATDSASSARNRAHARRTSPSQRGQRAQTWQYRTATQDTPQSPSAANATGRNSSPLPTVTRVRKSVSGHSGRQPRWGGRGHGSPLARRSCSTAIAATAPAGAYTASRG